ncbi:hypothetical protein HPP92_013716 [Vanilla planifolia]|uniref:Endonuclease/exonuclease/phosphatase domain-containing protein n=1 Tax=Vanilla planifolia TaxID=51239 RepID=A0A835R2H5_VANPL|nr:hypothetical protein HPP92_013716 [Vanilla planifolia]
MGNAESSSQLPKESNKEKEQETHESSATGKALKLGAAVAGSALLALGALSLTSSSSNHKDDSRQKLSVLEGSGPWKNESYRGGYFGRSAPNLIKIMSYNVWFREDVEVVKRMETIGKLILQHRPDVIFFQEVTPLIYSIFEDSDGGAFTNALFHRRGQIEDTSACC